MQPAFPIPHIVYIFMVTRLLISVGVLSHLSHLLLGYKAASTLICKRTLPFTNFNTILKTHMSSLSEVSLPHSEDKYDGVIIDHHHLPIEADDFAVQLKLSLEHWKSNHKRGVWLKIPLNKAKFVPIAAEMGFEYHHAEKDYVMMTHWLVDSENRLPANASHQVGVGCVVLHENKLLLVQEKNGPLRGTGVWKIPTGLVDTAEEISDAAVREVEEETGVKTEFLKVLCFRHAHNILFGKSDIFVLCVLRPLTYEITHQEAEIVACEWKEPAALFGQEFFQKSPIHILLNSIIQKEIDCQERNEEGVGLKRESLPIGWRPGENTVYYVDK